MFVVWLFFVILSLFVHWGFLYPLYLDDWISNSEGWAQADNRQLIADWLGTSFCLIPPAYILAVAIVFTNTKVKEHKAEKERLAKLTD